MKTNFRFLVVLGFILIFSGPNTFSQVSINTDNSPPDNSAMLDVKSTSKGILVPRMTLSERQGIESPASGLLVFQTDVPTGFYYNAGSPEEPDWKMIGNNVIANQISDADNDTFITTDEAPDNPDNDVINFWVKGQNTMSLVENRLVVSSGGDNLFIGDSCGAMNTTGAGNLFIGTRAGAKADLGTYNVFLGAFAGKKNQQHGNTFVGTFSGTNNTTGWNNTFVGYESGFSNISGRINTFIGNLSGYSNINGQRNIYLGDSSGYYNQAGVRSVYIGSGAGKNSQAGSRNIFIGDHAGAKEMGSYKLYLAISDTSEPLIYGVFNEGLLKFQAYRIEISNPERNTVIGHKAGLGSSGLHNVIIGDSAGVANMAGKNNIFIGTLSGTSNTFGSDNTFLGAWSGKNNTTGIQNVFIGNASGAANTDGAQNTFIGGRSGGNNTSGTYNVFIGDSTGQANTIGSINTFLGTFSGLKNTTGQMNLFLGTYAGLNNTEGHRNLFIGPYAGMTNTTGYRNTFIGLSSGASNTTGFYNTYLGRGTGLSNIDGSGNVFIGDLAGRNEMGSNKLYISNSDITNPLIYGEFDNSLLKLNGQVSINTNAAPPEPSAILEVNSTNKGFLMPRMTQAEMTSITNPANGLQVFSTTDNKLYIFLSSINRWKEVAFGTGELLPPATFSIGTGGACANTVVNGTYYPAVSLTTSSFVTIQVNVSVIGTYSITTNTVNGYSFNASGEFSTTGSQTINLMGNGTPMIAQTDQFTATASNNGGSCTFSVLVWTPCPGIPTISYGGQIYNTVQIGTQCWLKENLNIGTRIDGSIAQTDNSTIEKWCYNNLESNCDVYGGMYQWAEMVQYLNGATNTVSWNPVPTGNVVGICPTGWHIPSDAEWTTLFTALGGIAVAGGKLKETGTDHWLSPNTGATNSSGFTGLPSGRKDASFVKLGEYAPFYSSTQTSSNNMWISYLYADDVKITYVWHLKTNGIPARCVKD